MRDLPEQTSFAPVNRAYASVFRPNRLSLGLVMPIEAHGANPVASMERHIERAQLAEHLGFAALWLRDVPFNVPSFGDAGQIFDPFVYLGALSIATQDIALGVASIVLPLRHPAHVAKAAASVDVLSGGRLLLGVASGDRHEEYPALAKSFADRGASFREAVRYIRAMADPYPAAETAYGTLSGQMDMLPKPAGTRLPLLITGGSQQTPDWVAANGDGWMTYPRPGDLQGRVITDYRRRIRKAGLVGKPVMQSLYIDLLDDPDAAARPIHLGFQSGIHALRQHLTELEAHGVNHVALNLRFNNRDEEDTLKDLAENLLPDFT